MAERGTLILFKNVAAVDISAATGPNSVKSGAINV
jgi:hypothetical protein